MAAAATDQVLENRCPPNSIVSFPLDITFRPTDVQYNSVLESIPIMDFTWATEKGVIEEKSLTYLHWKGNKYTNVSAQLVGPTHMKWLLTEANPANNVADFIMTFQTNADTVSYRYIVVIVPLIRSEVPATSAPPYLQTFADPSRTQEYTLRTMFPASSTAVFANYTTCLRGYSAMKTPEMVSVFLAVGGIPVSSDLMDTIRTSRFPQKFPAFTPPFMTRLSPDEKQTVGTKTTPFQDFVQSTNQFLNYANAAKQYKDVSKLVREDSLDSYQCVPLDPDKNIQDGKIKVDLETGEVLSDVVAERAAVRAADSVKGSMEPGRLEKYMGSAIGIVLAIILFSLIIYMAYSWFSGRGVTSAATASAAVGTAVAGVATATADDTWAQSLPKYGLLVLVAGFGGFVIGAMLS